MTHPFRRFARLFCVAGGFSLAGWSLASTPGPAPSHATPSHCRLQAMKVEVALLADPATMRLPVAVLLEGDTVVLRGEVPDEPTRRRAVDLARQSCYLPVRDGLNVARQSLIDPKALKKASRDALVRSLGSKADRLVLTTTDDGQIKVDGEVASVEEKLHASRTLRQVPGCSRVINYLAVRTDGQAGQPVTVVSSDSNSVVCTAKAEEAVPRPALALQPVQSHDEPPLGPPQARHTLPSGLSRVPVIQAPALPGPATPPRLTPVVQAPAIPPTLTPVVPAPAAPPRMVPVVQAPAAPPPATPVLPAPAAPGRVTPFVQASAIPPTLTPVVQAPPPPASAPCVCAEEAVCAQDRPSMLDKLMAWKTARSGRKQHPPIPPEVLMPRMPLRTQAAEEAVTEEPARLAKATRPRRQEMATLSPPRAVEAPPVPAPQVAEAPPVTAPRVVPILAAEPSQAPAEASGQAGEARAWPPAHRASLPITPTPGNMTYVSRPLGMVSAAPRPPAVPWTPPVVQRPPVAPVPPPAPPMAQVHLPAPPLAQVPPPAPPAAAPSVVPTSAAPEPRLPIPEPARVEPMRTEPAQANPVMKVSVVAPPPIRMTEKDLKKRLTDTCGNLAREVRIELTPAGGVIVHVYALPATEHLLLARLLHVHELGAKNVQLHVHLAN